jgi:hypothetical protein
MALRRAKTEGEYLLVLAQAIQQLRRDWEARREALDAAAQGKESQKQEAEALRREAKSYADMARQAEQAQSPKRSTGWRARRERTLL